MEPERKVLLLMERIMGIQLCGRGFLSTGMAVGPKPNIEKTEQEDVTQWKAMSPFLSHAWYTVEDKDK